VQPSARAIEKRFEALSVAPNLVRRSVTQLNGGSLKMRFMVIVHASAESEAGVMPSTELLTAMGAFNEEMVSAGVMHAGEGLHATAKGARIRFADGEPVVTQGPFALTSDLIAGFWLIDVASRDEAVAWMKRAPFDGGVEIEIRQIFAPEDFGDALTPELCERETRLRAEAGKA
jgi:hypothetical protein